MKICLISAGTGTEFIDPTEFKQLQLRAETNDPQLGILNLAAVLEAQGAVPAIFDLNRFFFQHLDSTGEAGVDEFARSAAVNIVAENAEIYGFGTICSSYPLTVRIAREVKSLRPESSIVFGGPQASVVSDQTLQAFPFVDFVLRGEAEETLPRLLEELSGSRRFSDVPGLTHRSPFGVQRNPDAPLIVDLDALPSPAYHLTGELKGAPRASLELGRGCPFACTFCSTNDFFRRKFRLRSPERVLQDMRAIEREYGIRDFDLVHDMFTVDAKRVKAFCHALLDSGDGYTWSCSARTDCVDEELIELMAAAGCKGMFFGIESGSPRVQKLIDKHLDTARAHEIIDIAGHAGMRSTVSLIIGFPQENRQDLSDTLEMFMHSARTPLSSPQLNLLAPLANTPLHRQYKSEMTLDLLCSDMSHQGRKQHKDDRELIRRYPDIFPNFYLLPTPELDRGMLMELREFTLMTESKFRWLFGALHQATNDLLQLCLDWMQTRERLYPALAGSDLRHYYRTSVFRFDFLKFLPLHNVSESPLVHAFLEFEQKVEEAPSPGYPVDPGLLLLEKCPSLAESDIPVRKHNARIVSFSMDLNDMINAVKSRREFHLARSRQHYFVPKAENVTLPISHISPRIAMVLEPCDGSRSVRDIAETMKAGDLGVPEEFLYYTAVLLLEKARAEGLIEIFRTSSADTVSHGAGSDVEEYEAISASASEQNQFSAQAV